MPWESTRSPEKLNSNWKSIYSLSSQIKKIPKWGTQASSNVYAEQEPHFTSALQQRVRICCLNMQLWELPTTNPSLHRNKVCVPIFAISRTNITASTIHNPHPECAWKLLFQPQKNPYIPFQVCTTIFPWWFFFHLSSKFFLDLSAWSICHIVSEKQLSSPALFEETKKHF